ERSRHAVTPSPRHRPPSDVLAAVANSSGGGTAAAADRVEQSGLSRSIRPDDAVKDAVALDLQIELRQRLEWTVTHRQFLDLEHVRAYCVRRMRASTAAPRPKS